jgi:hypothetical protein
MDLRGNALKSLPQRLGQLTQLKKLDLRWNAISPTGLGFAALEESDCLIYT